MMGGLRGCALVVAVLGAGCVTATTRVLPPPPAPDKAVPRLPKAPEPPPPGYGLLVLDAVDGPMRAFETEQASFECTTPCAVTLEPGRYFVEFRGRPMGDLLLDEAQLLVEEGTAVYRRQMRQARRRSGLLVARHVLMYAGVVLMALGVPSMVVGAVRGYDESLWGGVGFTAVGAVSFGVGVALPREVDIVRPGSSVYFRVPSPGGQGGSP